MIEAFGDARLPERFWSKVDVDETGCWLWSAVTNPDGYGMYWLAGRMRGAHRVAYASLVRPLPDWSPGALVIDHLCRVRRCVNPAHLELVSSRTNTLRGETLAAEQVTRTHCPFGHPLEPGNLVAADARRGGRTCLTCSRRRARESKVLNRLLDEVRPR